MGTSDLRSVIQQVCTLLQEAKLLLRPDDWAACSRIDGAWNLLENALHEAPEIALKKPRAPIDRAPMDRTIIAGKLRRLADDIATGDS